MAVTPEGGCRVSDMREGDPVVEGTLRIWNRIGRATGALPVSWSDADVLSWSVREPETAEAMRAYVRKNLSQDT